MKKIISIALVLLAMVVTITGCNSYKPDTSGFTKEYVEKEQRFLNEFKNKYENATTDADKELYAFETGFRYMNLGKYTKAIKYYEIVLKLNPEHPQALNNLAVIYEEMSEFQKALTYEQKLYNKNATSTEVVMDTIRLLVKNKQLNDAQGVLDKFASTEEGKSQGDFLSEQMQYLTEAREKALE
jgi:tetratricopeptide (TPR) repeat protein